ncbi:hypothetical protein LSAT2_007311 [Lamellibrachia satsuma]|nr:hypothetical protein LSAT2_007311 [Lamellibrachia satsuma]
MPMLFGIFEGLTQDSVKTEIPLPVKLMRAHRAPEIQELKADTEEPGGMDSAILEADVSYPYEEEILEKLIAESDVSYLKSVRVSQRNKLAYGKKKFVQIQGVSLETSGCEELIGRPSAASDFTLDRRDRRINQRRHTHTWHWLTKTHSSSEGRDSLVFSGLQQHKKST